MLLLAALPLAACSEATPETDGSIEIPIADLNPEQKAMFDLAKEAAGGLGKAMVGELTQTLSADGPVAAIEQCRLRAPEALAQASADMPGIHAIGRTSHRLRNPENSPPAWAAETVAAADGKPHAFTGEDDRLHVLLPIPIQPACLVCHGAPEVLPEALKAELLVNYPHDQATGFQPEDLRGWFWVEVNP